MHPRKFRSLELIVSGFVLALLILLAMPLFSGFPEPAATPSQPEAVEPR